MIIVIIDNIIIIINGVYIVSGCGSCCNTAMITVIDTIVVDHT